MKKIRGNKEKEEFRKSKEWREFRKKLIEERGTYCQCCHKKTKLLQCHHADNSIENYDKLNKDKFFLLCSYCHKGVSDLERIKPENRIKLRSKECNEYFGRFLIAESKS